ADLLLQFQEYESPQHHVHITASRLPSRLDGLRQRRESANIALTETKGELASGEQLCASLRQQQQPLEQRISELRHLAEQRRNEIGGFAARKEQWLAEIEESRRHIERLRHEREITSAQTAELMSQRDIQENAIQTREDE